jgi:hypothetical protein
MIVLLQLIALGLFALIAVNIRNGLKRGGASPIEPRGRGTTIEGTARELTPAARAAMLLREFDNARSELKGKYPAIFAMLGGYLNHHTLVDVGGVEAAVDEMIADWAPRREEAMRELTRLLAENETEEEVRAIVNAACDATFDQEGYRAFLTFLLGRFNHPLGNASHDS